MRVLSSIHALLLAAACFYLVSANAAEIKFPPYVIEMYRCQDVIQMSLDLLPLCTHDGWDVQSITKAAQAHAQYECETRKAVEELDANKPDYQPVHDAKERRDKFLQSALTPKQILELLELKGITDLIHQKADDIGDAYASAYAKQLRKIVSKSPVLTTQEVSGWKVTLQDVSEILQAMKTSPKLAFPEIQSAIDLSQEALKKYPEKAAALVKQLTETLQKAEVVM